MIPKNLQDWLNERCPDSDISNRSGVFYLSNDTCERKLDEMQRNFSVVWSTRNYKSNLYYFNDELWISASLELVITGNSKKIDRSVEGFKKILVGCATFKSLSIVPNTHLDATAKAFCTVNAAMDLGDQFGRFLSTQITPHAQELLSRKKPDPIIIQKYHLAKMEKDQTTIEEIERSYIMDEYSDQQIAQ